mmetsp:Transcript_53235/g.159374  ORF Transcript_53235/g.159374 Transcript_53235/m.159374 type:complete len:286 (-) Transcript_53235:966-1823(-)
MADLAATEVVEGILRRQRRAAGEPQVDQHHRDSSHEGHLRQQLHQGRVAAARGNSLPEEEGVHLGIASRDVKDAAAGGPQPIVDPLPRHLPSARALAAEGAPSCDERRLEEHEDGLLPAAATPGAALPDKHRGEEGKSMPDHTCEDEEEGRRQPSSAADAACTSIEDPAEAVVVHRLHVAVHLRAAARSSPAAAGGARLLLAHHMAAAAGRRDTTMACDREGARIPRHTLPQIRGRVQLQPRRKKGRLARPHLPKPWRGAGGMGDERERGAAPDGEPDHACPWTR